MLKSGILNPALLSLLARIRHTNMPVMAGSGLIRTGDTVPCANPIVEPA